MSFLPEDEIKGRSGLNMTPMIDFLFLMLMFFACLAVTRMATRDTNIDLVEVKPESSGVASDGEEILQFVNITIQPNGQYHWVTDVQDHPINGPDELAKELRQQYERGFLPQDKQQTQILLKIDKAAQWDPILRAIFAIREEGFDVYPVYEPEETGYDLANR